MLPIFKYDDEGHCLMHKVNISEIDIINTVSEFLKYQNSTSNPDLSAFFKKEKVKGNIVRALALVGLSSCINDIVEIEKGKLENDKENTGN